MPRTKVLPESPRAAGEAPARRERTDSAASVSTCAIRSVRDARNPSRTGQGTSLGIRQSLRAFQTGGFSTHRWNSLKRVPNGPIFRASLLGNP
jgi:hypothetical protein